VTRFPQSYKRDEWVMLDLFLTQKILRRSISQKEASKVLQKLDV
jgi:hypothetical protein